MAINYGASSQSRTREYATTLVKVITASIQSDSFPFSISYTLDTDIDTVASVQVEYSTDSGQNWYTATPDPADPNHDAITGINLLASSVLAQTFIWDAYPDLNPLNDYSFAGPIAVRIRAADSDSNFTAWTELPVFTFDTTFSIDITGIQDKGHYIDVLYDISGLSGTYSVTLEYSTGGAYASASIYNPSTTHTPNVAASVGSGVYSWWSQSNLSSTFDGQYTLRISTGNGVVTSDFNISDAIPKTYLPVVELQDIDPIVGNTMEVPYLIKSDRSETSNFDVTVSYSTDGSTFYNATAETSNPNHSGVTGLTKGSRIFAWDIDADLQANQLIENAVIVKITASDGTSSSSPVQTDPFTVNMVPSVTLGAVDQISENVKIPFSINSLNDDETYTVEMEFSTDGVAFATAPANTGITGHAESGLSKETTYTYVWDSLTSLGNTFDGTYYLRARVTNGLPDTGGQAYNQYSAYSDVLSIAFDYTPSIEIKTYPTGAVTSSPILIGYNVQSYVTATSIVYLEYSTDAGQNWGNATPDYTNPSHSGTSSANNGSSGIDGGLNTFAWDIHTDLGTVSDTTILFRLKIDLTGSNFNYSEDIILSTNSVPGQPTVLDPQDDYFDTGQSEAFDFIIPSDVGSENIHFKFDLLSGGTGESEITKESHADFEHFQHRVQTSSGLKQQDEIGILYYVSNVKVPLGTLTFTYADYKDSYSESTLASPGNYEIVLVNKTDRRVYVTNVTTTSCVLNTSAGGTDDYGLVDIIVFDNNAGTYFKTITQTDESVAYTLGSGDLATDVASRTIPSSITNVRPFLVEGSDTHFYLSNVTDSGFTLNKSNGSVGVSDTVTICLIQDPTKVYQHDQFDLSSFSIELNTSSLIDDPSGTSAWPSYMPGMIAWSVDYLGRAMNIRALGTDMLYATISGSGETTSNPYCTSTIFAICTKDEHLPYYTNVSPNGVPDSYEGEYGRFVLRDLDTPSAGTYTWSIAAGNEE